MNITQKELDTNKLLIRKESFDNIVSQHKRIILENTTKNKEYENLQKKYSVETNALLRELDLLKVQVKQIVTKKIT